MSPICLICGGYARDISRYHAQVQKGRASGSRKCDSQDDSWCCPLQFSNVFESTLQAVIGCMNATNLLGRYKAWFESQEEGSFVLHGWLDVARLTSFAPKPYKKWWYLEILRVCVQLSSVSILAQPCFEAFPRKSSLCETLKRFYILCMMTKAVWTWCLKSKQLT